MDAEPLHRYAALSLSGPHPARPRLGGLAVGLLVEPRVPVGDMGVHDAAAPRVQGRVVLAGAHVGEAVRLARRTDAGRADVAVLTDKDQGQR